MRMLSTMLLGDIENSSVSDLELVLELQRETSTCSIFDARDVQGRTVLHVAALKGSVPVLRRLVGYMVVQVLHLPVPSPPAHLEQWVL